MQRLQDLVLALGVSVAAAISASAQTTVCGPVPSGTVWSLADSPIEVTCDLSVSDLTVDPGVEVHLEGDHEIVVSGILRVLGTQDAPVLFLEQVTEGIPADQQRSGPTERRR